MRRIIDSYDLHLQQASADGRIAQIIARLLAHRGQIEVLNAAVVTIDLRRRDDSIVEYSIPFTANAEPKPSELEP